MGESMAIIEPMEDNISMKKAFEEMCNNRVYQMNDFDFFPQTPENKVMTDRISMLIDELKEILPDDKKKLLNELDETYSDQLLYDQGRFYNQGVSDGKELVSLILKVF